MIVFIIKSIQVLMITFKIQYLLLKPSVLSDGHCHLFSI